MIPNFKMGYFHKKEYLGLQYNIQMDDTLSKKPLKTSVDGFEYSSLLTSKTYSILSYIVGGFVGSKSQMNYHKHNLSYDLSAAIFNLLNPCKYEREKSFRKSSENFYNSATVSTSPDGYEKYIVKSSQKEKMINMGLELFENYMRGFQEECNKPNPTKKISINCDDKVSNDSQNSKDSCKVEDYLGHSIDVTDRVTNCGIETTEETNMNHIVRCPTTERLRQLSVCSVESTDSESFIVFDNPDQEDEKKSEENWKLENFYFDNDIENDDDDDEEDDEDDDDVNDDDDNSDGEGYDYYDSKICCDDYEICLIERELEEANDRWKRNYEDVESEDDKEERKVRFNDKVKINKIVAWDYAYRAARPGPWEQMARDRVRFRERILRLSPTISAVLKKEHRDKVYKELYS